MRLYDVFARYAYTGRAFCEVCYSRGDWERIPADGRKLLWEAASHWESAGLYRHYLPRLLELMGPPWRVDPLYRSHVFEMLIAMGFQLWSFEEQSAIVECLEFIGADTAGLG